MSKLKQPRKELTSLRLEPQVKYLTELAARAQRRSLTNYIEWVLAEAVNTQNIESNNPNSQTIGELKLQLWGVEQQDRLLKLQDLAPHLLTYDEQVFLKELENE